MKKYFKNLWNKILSIKADNYAIAAGLACGVAVSFSPFVGFHIIIASFVALCLRASVVAAAIGTVFGNPWTFPLIWSAVFYCGEKMLKIEHKTGEIDFSLMFEKAGEMLKNLNFEGFFVDIWPILYPMMIGAIPFCLLSWIITYIITLKLLRKYRGKNYDIGNRH